VFLRERGVGEDIFSGMSEFCIGCRGKRGLFDTVYMCR
jgi:hypothetical protein